jgi:hypothetical protein
LLTDVPYENLTCQNCHDSAQWEDQGVEWPGPNCNDCHVDGIGEPIDDSVCLGCHGRQSAEANLFEDVHRTAGVGCSGCHGSVAVHGDGNTYDSFLDPDYPQAACEDCHVEGGSAPAPPDSVTGHATHVYGTKLVDCSACHMQSVITCYNCHFDSELEAPGTKRPFRQLTGYVMLLNRQGKNKVYGGTYMTLVTGEESFVVVAPYYAHTIVREGRECSACHANFGGDIPAINEYNDTGTITITSWDETAEGPERITGITGIVPVPEGWEDVFQFAYVDYEGDPAAPTDPGQWVFLTGETDLGQLLFGSPLTDAQMTALGATGP